MRKSLAFVGLSVALMFISACDTGVTSGSGAEPSQSVQAAPSTEAPAPSPKPTRENSKSFNGKLGDTVHVYSDDALYLDITVVSVTDAPAESNQYMRPEPGMIRKRIASKVCAIGSDSYGEAPSDNPFNYAVELTDGTRASDYAISDARTAVSSDPIPVDTCVNGTVDYDVPSGVDVVAVQWSLGGFIARWAK